MNEPLVKRIVGAAVLLILAGMLWPILFNFDDAMRPQTTTIKASSKDQALFEQRKQKISDITQDATAAVETKAESSITADTSDNQPISSDSDSLSVSPSNSDAIVPSAESTPDVATSNVVSLDDRRIPISYVVQVGTFSRWDNADKLRARIIADGMKAYIRPETSVQKGPYVVAVGPYLTKQKAERAQAQIKSDFNISDAVLRRFRDL